MVYSIIIGSDLERLRSYVIIALEPEISCLGYQGTTAGASFEVYSVIIGSD